MSALAALQEIVTRSSEYILAHPERKDALSHLRFIAQDALHSAGERVEAEGVSGHDIERFSNPWTVEICVKGAWQEFCYDSPQPLALLEKRIEEFTEENPQALLRAVPWLNNMQRQHVTDRISYLEGQIAEKDALLERSMYALKAWAGLAEHQGISTQSHRTHTRELVAALAAPAVPNPTREICICAAIRMPNGEVIRGHRHNHCYDVVRARPAAVREDIIAAEQGFVTSKNRFADRHEAMKLQQAAGVPSCYRKDGAYAGSGLFSEDLYSEPETPAVPPAKEPAEESLGPCELCGNPSFRKDEESHPVCPQCETGSSRG